MINFDPVELMSDPARSLIRKGERSTYDHNRVNPEVVKEMKARAEERRERKRIRRQQAWNGTVA